MWSSDGALLVVGMDHVERVPADELVGVDCRRWPRGRAGPGDGAVGLEIDDDLVRLREHRVSLRLSRLPRKARLGCEGRCRRVSARSCGRLRVSVGAAAARSASAVVSRPASAMPIVAPIRHLHRTELEGRASSASRRRRTIVFASCSVRSAQTITRFSPPRRHTWSPGADRSHCRAVTCTMQLVAGRSRRGLDRWSSRPSTRTFITVNRPSAIVACRDPSFTSRTAARRSGKPVTGSRPASAPRRASSNRRAVMFMWNSTTPAPSCTGAARRVQHEPAVLERRGARILELERAALTAEDAAQPIGDRRRRARFRSCTSDRTRRGSSCRFPSCRGSA